MIKIENWKSLVLALWYNSASLCTTIFFQVMTYSYSVTLEIDISPTILLSIQVYAVLNFIETISKGNWLKCATGKFKGDFLIIVVNSTH